MSNKYVSPLSISEPIRVSCFFILCFVVLFEFRFPKSVRYLLSSWLQQPERKPTERSEPSTPRASTTLATSFWPFSYLCRNSLSTACRWSPSPEPAPHSRRAGGGPGQSRSFASPRSAPAGSSFQDTTVNSAGDNGRCPG